MPFLEILKQAFIIYGWDSYNTLQNKEDQDDQEQKVGALRRFITQTLADAVCAQFSFINRFELQSNPITQDKNNTILGSSVFSFADIYHMAEDEKYVYGDPSATCPDVNAWLQVNIKFDSMNGSALEIDSQFRRV